MLDFFYKKLYLLMCDKFKFIYDYSIKWQLLIIQQIKMLN